MSSLRPPRGGGRGSRRNETRREEESFSSFPLSPFLYPPSFLYLSTYFFLLPFFHPPPFPLCLSLVFGVAAKYHKFGPSIWSGGEANPHQTNRLQKTCRREPDEILLPIRPSLPPPPTCSLFTPSSPDCPGFIPGHCPRPSSRDATKEKGEGGGKRPWDRNQKILEGLKREKKREPPFDHRFAAEKLLYSSRLMVNGHGFVHPFSSSTLAPRTAFYRCVCCQ